jgi:hypothetical protein
MLLIILVVLYSKNNKTWRGNCKSPPFVIPNEVRNLRGIDIKRFLPLVEMTVDAFFDFCNYLWISHRRLGWLCKALALPVAECIKGQLTRPETIITKHAEQH